MAQAPQSGQVRKSSANQQLLAQSGRDSRRLFPIRCPYSLKSASGFLNCILYLRFGSAPNVRPRLPDPVCRRHRTPTPGFLRQEHTSPARPAESASSPISRPGQTRQRGARTPLWLLLFSCAPLPDGPGRQQARRDSYTGCGRHPPAAGDIQGTVKRMAPCRHGAGPCQGTQTSDQRHHRSDDDSSLLLLGCFNLQPAEFARFVSELRETIGE